MIEVLFSVFRVDGPFHHLANQRLASRGVMASVAI
jgi:hypothetical protein